VRESCFLEITDCTIWHNYVSNLGTRLVKISICDKMEPGDSIYIFFVHNLLKQIKGYDVFIVQLISNEIKNLESDSY